MSWLQPVVQEVKVDQLRDEGLSMFGLLTKKRSLNMATMRYAGRLLLWIGRLKNEKLFTCILKPTGNYGAFASLLMQVSLVIAQHAEGRGGVLLHGALVEKDGVGVVLAGPGGVGKTTASRRLAPALAFLVRMMLRWWCVTSKGHIGVIPGLPGAPLCLTDPVAAGMFSMQCP